MYGHAHVGDVDPKLICLLDLTAWWRCKVVRDMASSFPCVGAWEHKIQNPGDKCYTCPNIGLQNTLLKWDSGVAITKNVALCERLTCVEHVGYVAHIQSQVSYKYAEITGFTVSLLFSCLVQPARNLLPNVSNDSMIIYRNSDLKWNNNR